MKRKTKQQRRKKIVKRLAAYSAVAAATATAVASQSTANAAEVNWDIDDVPVFSWGRRFNVVTGATAYAAGATSHTADGSFNAGSAFFYGSLDMKARVGDTSGAFMGVFENSYNYAFALSPGVTVGVAGTFVAHTEKSANGNYAWQSLGDSSGYSFLTPKFVGLKFSISGQTHYGWAEFTGFLGPLGDEGVVLPGFNGIAGHRAVLHGFGYNDTPGAASVTPASTADTISPWDITGDGNIDAADISAIRAGNPAGDIDSDGDVDEDDVTYWLGSLGTRIEDTTLDGNFTVEDLDKLTLAGDLTAGVAPPAGEANLDLDGNGTVGSSDLNQWLTNAAIVNGRNDEDGFDTPYQVGDTDLDRDVDITDFNKLATAFDPGGVNVATNKWSVGDGDGDGDVDISDFNILATNFAPGGYSDAEAAVADADPGQVDLIVDLANGEVTLDGNAAAISGLQIFSAGDSLLAADFTADVLQFVISTNTSTYAEGAFVNTGVDGEISLGVLYDLLVDARDVTFEYTMIGQPTVQGVVNYIPEPSSILLLGAGAAGLAGWRRRRDR